MKSIEKICIVESSPEFSLSVKRELKKRLTKEKFKILENEKNKKGADVVIALGGDRAFLTAVHQTKFDPNALYIGINTGSLGFLQDVSASEIPVLIELLKHPDQIRTEKLEVMQVTLSSKRGKQITKFALNEVLIAGKDHASFGFTESVNREMWFDVMANGISISTNTGSTGLNRSIGGAIITTHGIMCSSLIAPIRNAVTGDFIESPIIGNQFDVKVNTIKTGIDIVIDGYNQNIPLDSIDEVKISLRQKEIKRIQYSSLTQGERIRKKLLRI